MVILFATLGLASFPSGFAWASSPQITSSLDVSGNTVLTIRFDFYEMSDPPTPSHYPTDFQIRTLADGCTIADGCWTELPSVAISPTPTTTIFTATYNLGQVTTDLQVQARLNCNIHGWSSWGPEPPTLVGSTSTTASTSSVTQTQTSTTSSTMTSETTSTPSVWGLVWVRMGPAGNAGVAAADSTGIYVVGTSSSRMEKRNINDGSIIWTLDGTQTAIGGIQGITVDNSGVYLVGSSDSGWAIEKRKVSDGSLLWTQTTTGYNGGFNGIAIEPTGVYVITTEIVLGCHQSKVEKRQPSDGSLVWTIVSAPSPPYCSIEAWGVAADTSGVYVASLLDDAQGGEARIDKRSLNDGSLIWTKAEPDQYQNFVPTREPSIAVADGGVYMILYPWLSPYITQRVEKRSALDGSLLWTQSVNPSAGGELLLRSIVADSSGVYSAGYDYSAARHKEWYIEQRNPQDGSLIWHVWESPSGIDDGANSVAVDGSGELYVTGYEHDPNFPGLDLWEWRIEKRSLGITTTTSPVTFTETTSITQIQTSTTSTPTTSVTSTMPVIHGTVYWVDQYGDILAQIRS